MLPCADIAVSVAFYEQLGFKRTYHQLRPNPHAVVALEDIHIHLFGMDGFDPQGSYASVIVTVPDAGALYQAFATGLRQHYGKLPVHGIPRLLRPRKKYGTVSGFSLVDPGGNWVRVYQQGAEEETDLDEEASGLAQIILVAARLGDARGDELLALKTLETGLERYKDAAAPDLARAYLYRAELAIRTNNAELAHSSLRAAELLTLSDAESTALADEFAHIRELLAS